MDHFISLKVASDKVTDDLAKLWYRSAKSGLPDGLLTTLPNGDERVSMKKTKKDGSTIFLLPLIRNLTSNEVENVIEKFDEVFDGDFSVSSSRIKVEPKEEIEVEVDHKPLIDLCTAWAKEQHDEWMKAKIEAGWRYGPSVSMANKTHPLLRQWSDLPDSYKVVDTSKPEEMLKLFNDHGYVLVTKQELDELIKAKS